MMPPRLILASLLLALPVSALADPCVAPLPRPSTTFSGIVRYIGDGDSLCVSMTSDPRTWIEVRLGDFSAPELREAAGPRAKAMLKALTYGRYLVCRAGRQSYDRVVARCQLDGAGVGDLLRQNGAVEGGN
ncbi:MAG TPA: nuclease [Caulobacter sp.]|nr:nuclease [Caulobacter sp.]